jgi:hypothetical protein
MLAGTRRLVFEAPWPGSTKCADEPPQRVHSPVFGNVARRAFLFAVALALNCLTAIEAYAEADRRQPNALIVYSNDPELPAIQLLARGTAIRVFGESHSASFHRVF